MQGSQMEKSFSSEERVFWDNYAGRYDRFMKRLSDEYATLIDLIWKEIQQDDIVIEIATGTGIIALDISKKAKKLSSSAIL